MMDRILGKAWKQIGSNKINNSEVVKHLKTIMFGKSKKIGESISQLHKILTEQYNTFCISTHQSENMQLKRSLLKYRGKMSWHCSN